jgi:hypothetical protein
LATRARSALVALRKTIDALDQVQCMALLWNIDEVYTRAAQSTTADLYQISKEVYDQNFL